MSFSGGIERIDAEDKMIFANANGDDANQAYSSIIRDRMIDLIEQGALSIVASGNKSSVGSNDP